MPTEHNPEHTDENETSAPGPVDTPGALAEKLARSVYAGVQPTAETDIALASVFVQLELAKKISELNALMDTLTTTTSAAVEALAALAEDRSIPDEAGPTPETTTRPQRRSPWTTDDSFFEGEQPE